MSSIVNSVRSLLTRPVGRHFEYNWIRARIPYISKVLDVGCVRGKGIQNLTKALLRSTCFVTGVSFQPIDFVHENFCYVQGDVMATNFEEESFDCVVASHVIQHLGLPYWDLNQELDEDADKKFVEKVHGWLKENGTFFVLVPFCKKFRILKYSSKCSYRVYNMTRLYDLFLGMFLMKEYVVFDGAHDTKKRISGARAILIKLRKC